jgi:Na+-transporting methylmalonyl-CoA/oxaloacetate decarboxylase gamma subunit
MGRVLFFIVLLVLILSGIGFLALGAFPPEPSVAPVHKVLPNDRFIRGGG